MFYFFILLPFSPYEVVHSCAIDQTNTKKKINLMDAHVCVCVDHNFSSKMVDFCMFHARPCHSMRKQNAFASEGNVLFIFRFHVHAHYSIKQDAEYVLNVIFCSFFMLFDRDKPKMTRGCETHYRKRKEEQVSERLRKRKQRTIDHKHQSCLIRFCVVYLYRKASIPMAVILNQLHQHFSHRTWRTLSFRSQFLCCTKCIRHTLWFLARSILFK